MYPQTMFILGNKHWERTGKNNLDGEMLLITWFLGGTWVSVAGVDLIPYSYNSPKINTSTASKAYFKFQFMRLAVGTTVYINQFTRRVR